MIIQPKVTQENVDKGYRGNRRFCPEALALSQACGQPMKITADMFCPSYSPFGAGWVETPLEIRQRIASFDSGLPMVPHEWPPVEVPDNWVKGAKR